MLSSKQVPQTFDIICGRGTGYQHHLGNKKFQETIEEFKGLYQAATPTEKNKISLDILQKLRSLSPGGHFLRREGQRWVDIGDNRAREKINQAMREAALKSQYQSKKRKKNLVPDSAMVEELLNKQQQLFKKMMFDSGYGNELEEYEKKSLIAVVI
mmetsp:Transcript_30337/g.61868  ORF Transcript_30337/g.61868 Transcript_30337/m.61868 type:complete len:156 (-) Transcript_30337:49-516(-)